MDKMTVNMIAGAVLSALLVIVGMNTFVNILYPKGGGPQPEAEGQQQAGAAATPGAAAGGGAAPAQASQPIGVLLAAAKAEAGEKAAKVCVTCHSFEAGGANKIGPNLHNIVGRQVANVEGFAYSPALKAKGGVWDYELLSCFLANPKDCIPNNKMAFRGLQKDAERADVIAYLRAQTDNPPPLPAAASGGPGAAVSPPAASTPGVNPAAVERPGGQGPAPEQPKPVGTQ
jgi:cytochrome c